MESREHEIKKKKITKTIFQRTQTLRLLCESCEFNKSFADSKNEKDLNRTAT